MRAPALAVMGLALAAPLSAQASRFLSAGLGAGTAHLHTAPAGGSSEVLSGALIGGNVTLNAKRFSLEGFYAQGNLTADTGSATSRDIVDGSLMAAVRPISWLAIKGGLHLRAYVTPGFTARPAAWELRLRGEGPVITGRVTGFAEVFRSVKATTNVGVDLDYWQGGSAGVTLHLPRAPVWGRFSYFIDQTVGVDNGTETLDGITISIGFGGH